MKHIKIVFILVLFLVSITSVSALIKDPVRTSYWNVSSATFIEYLNLSTRISVFSGLYFRDDGLKMYEVDSTSGLVEEYVLSTAWNITTATYLRGFSLAAKETQPSGIFIKPDGLKLYSTGQAGDSIDVYTLSTAWDISSAVYEKEISSVDTNPKDIFLSADGSRLYITGYITAQILQFNLSTPWDISTAVNVANKSVSAKESNPSATFFRNDGLKMYVLGMGGDSVDEWTLSIPWEVSSATYLREVSIAAQDPTGQGLWFNPKGLQMYMVGSTSKLVYEYNLSWWEDLFKGRLTMFFNGRLKFFR